VIESVTFKMPEGTTLPPIVLFAVKVHSVEGMGSVALIKTATKA
jgi:hypothetical protein